jgi:MFS transporter, ACS family, glucarate transporter
MKTTCWVLVVLLALTATVSFLCRVNLSVVGALVMRDFGFSQVAMGRVFSALVLGYSLFQVPAGMMADRWGARRVLLIAGLWWTLGTIMLAATGWGPLRGAPAMALWELILLRFAIGVGESPTYPAAAQGVAQWIAPARQGVANSVVMTSIALGSGLAPPFLSIVMVRWGWRVALLTSAIPALLIALAWAKVRDIPVKAPIRLHSASSGTDRRALLSRSFVLLTISYTLEGYVGYIFIFWFYLYLVQERHFDLLRAGRLGSLPWILSVITIPTAGILSDKLIWGRLGFRWGRRIIPMVGLGFAGIFLALGARTTSGYAAVLYMSLSTAFLLSVESPFWTAMMEIAGPNAGTGGGIMNFGSNFGGFISPALTPILGAHLGWKTALYVAAALSVIGACLWLGISPDGERILVAESSL